MQKTIPFLFAFLLTSCAQPPVPAVVGGACSYKSIEGIAVITSTMDPTDSSLCKHQKSKSIRFQFVAEHKKETNRDQLLEISNIHVFPVTWLNKKGLVISSKHRMTKQVIQSGTCTPVIYSLSNMDENNEVTVITKMCNSEN